MDAMLQFARGPLFLMCFLFMALSLIRLVIMHTVAIPAALKKTQSKEVDAGAMAGSVIQWLTPIKALRGPKPLFSVISFVWHVALIAVPLFLIDHLLLWQRGTGIPWPDAFSLNRHIADVLTVIVVAFTIVLFVMRAIGKQSRAISEPVDYLILLLVLVPFVTGFMAAHPAINPIGYSLTMLMHVLSAEALFVIIPMSKLSHMVLFPFGRVASDIYWRFPAGTGDKVRADLAGEDAIV